MSVFIQGKLTNELLKHQVLMMHLFFSLKGQNKKVI